MPRIQVQMFLAALCLAVLGASVARAERFEIMDGEGFERKMPAKVVTVPEGWKSEGRIAWNKPCSGNDLYETLFQTRSPDGKSGARIMPGYQFFKDFARYTPGYPRDPILDMMLAQSEALNQNMRTQFRGSNCGVAEVEGSKTILRQLILPKRPADVRITKVTPNTSYIDLMRQSFGGGIPGVALTFDAQIIELSYTLGSTPTTERLYLSWYRFAQEPMDMGGITVRNSHTIVEPLTFMWAPTADAPRMLQRTEAIFASFSTNPAWQRKVNALRRKMNEQNDADRRQREAESDRRHREFLETITGNPGGASDVPLPSGPADTTPQEDVAETDYWGEPKEETDYWGEPVNREDD